MALTYTPNQPDLGKPCPDFSLKAVDGRIFSKNDFANAKALVVMFICNHCPYVIAVEDRLLSLARELQPKGAQFVAICANDAENYPDDAPEKLLQRTKEKKYPFPYLYDETQEVAQKFEAVCTPDLYVYDSKLKLAYRGRLDDSWKDPSKVTKQELKEAIEAVLHQQPVNEKQNPSMGCNIKWKKDV